MLLVGEGALAVLGALGLVYGHVDLTEIAIGAFVGLIAGHVNGTHGAPP